VGGSRVPMGGSRVPGRDSMVPEMSWESDVEFVPDVVVIDSEGTEDDDRLQQEIEDELLIARNLQVMFVSLFCSIIYIFYT